MRLAHRIEAAGARAAFALLGWLSPSTAARLAGSVARTLGPWLPVSRIARINLSLALPEFDARARARIIRDMWWNLGCTVGELPHLAALRCNHARSGFEIEGEEIMQALARQGGPAIFFSGHIGNWELLPQVGASIGIPFASMYRAAANPVVDAMIADFRLSAGAGQISLLPKGAQGARGALAHLLKGGVLAGLVDQKMNDGIPVSLFGRPAMTAPAVAALALRFQCPLIPAHSERLGPARLRVIVEPPLPLPASGDRAADIAALTRTMNACLERWIVARPEGWLWLHRRYGREEYVRARR